MPSSSSSPENRPSDSSSGSATDFVLKHRLIGAGILISIGVLFLPWILGSYSVDKDSKDSVEATVKNELSEGGGFQSTDNQDIKVFVSKIKPVGSGDSGKKNTETNGKAPVSAPKPDDVASSVPVIKPDKPKVDSKKGDASKEPKVAKKAESKPAKIVDKPVEKTNDVAKTSKPVKEKSSGGTDIKQGYIVSVGVFSEQKNVAAVMQDLRSKKFKPSSSKIQTNAGEATRVWLGPFATRAEAGKEKSKLLQGVGESGLILKYP